MVISEICPECLQLSNYRANSVDDEVVCLDCGAIFGLNYEGREPTEEELEESYKLD